MPLGVSFFCIEDLKQVKHTCCLTYFNRAKLEHKLVGGGIHLFMLCPTSFFSNQIQSDQFEKKSVEQNMNI